MRNSETFVVPIVDGRVRMARGLCRQCQFSATCGSNIFENRVEINGRERPVYHFDVTGNKTGSSDCLFQQRFDVWGHSG